MGQGQAMLSWQEQISQAPLGPCPRLPATATLRCPLGFFCGPRCLPPPLCDPLFHNRKKIPPILPPPISHPGTTSLFNQADFPHHTRKAGLGLN